MDNKVYRSELTPVDFLRRSAYMFPEKTAVVYGGRRYYLRRVRGARQPPRLAPARLGARRRATGLPFSAQTRRRMLEGHFAVPAAGLVLVAINTRLGKDEVTYIVEHSGAKMVFVDAELEKLLADVRRRAGPHRRHRRGREIPTRTIWQRALPSPSRACWRTKRRPSP